MRHVYYELDIGYCGCGEEGVIEVPEDASDSYIDNLVDQMTQEYAASWEGDTRLCWDEDMSEEEWEDATQSFYENVSGLWRDATPHEVEEYGVSFG